MSDADSAEDTVSCDETLLVVRRGDRFAVTDLAGGRSVEASDLGRAYAALRGAGSRLDGDPTRRTAPTEAAPPGDAAIADPVRALRSLTRPGVLLGAVVLGLAIGQLGQVVARIGSAVGTVADVHDAGRAALDKLHGLARAAEDVSPERAAAVRRDLRVIVARLAPFVHELAPLVTPTHAGECDLAGGRGDGDGPAPPADGAAPPAVAAPGRSVGTPPS